MFTNKIGKNEIKPFSLAAVSAAYFVPFSKIAFVCLLDQYAVEQRFVLLDIVQVLFRLQNNSILLRTQDSQRFVRIARCNQYFEENFIDGFCGIFFYYTVANQHTAKS